MTKNDLMSIQRINQEIDILNKLLEEYDEAHPVISSPQITGMPSGGKKVNKIEQRAEKKAEYLKHISELRAELHEKQAEIMEFIKSIPDAYLRMIIELYCLTGRKWYQVAMDMKTSESSVKMYYYRNIDKYLEKEAKR